MAVQATLTTRMICLKDKSARILAVEGNRELKEVRLIRPGKNTDYSKEQNGSVQAVILQTLAAQLVSIKSEVSAA